MQQRVQIAVLLCNFAMSSNSIRTQLDDAEENRKEMRKELVHLRAKLKRQALLSNSCHMCKHFAAHVWAT